MYLPSTEMSQAQHRPRLFGLEYSGSIRSPPSIEQVIFSSTHKPFTTIGKLQGEHTALAEVQLVLVRLIHVQDFHVAAIHANSQPLPHWAVSKGEDL